MKKLKPSFCGKTTSHEKIASCTTGPGAPAAKVDLTPGELSKDEIRDGVREVIPLLTECYELMLDKHPRLGGKVMARLTVEAEPDVGTIITMQDDSPIDMRGAAAGIDARSLQTDLNDFGQCLTATLESVALPPLGDKDGGRIEINYPFIFAPSEEQAEDIGENEQPPAPPKPPGPTQRKAPPPSPEPEPDPAIPASKLLAEAETAAKSSQWARALVLSEQSMARAGDRGTAARAALVAALAACNLKRSAKAKAYYPRVTPSAKTLIRERCRVQGIEVVDDTIKDPFAEDPSVRDPFGGGSKPKGDQQSDLTNPFK